MDEKALRRSEFERAHPAASAGGEGIAFRRADQAAVEGGQHGVLHGDALLDEQTSMGDQLTQGPGLLIGKLHAGQEVGLQKSGQRVGVDLVGLDPGVNVIAGMRPNRMSAVACDNIGGPTAGGTNPAGTSCDVETLLIAASAFNPSMNADGGRMKPGGGVGEYSIHPDDADGASGPCTGAHGPANAINNTGCAQPIAQFLGRNPDVGTGPDLIDPRMLMVIHQPFIQ